MSATNDEEINEITEDIVEEKVEENDIVNNEIPAETEQQTEPMDIMAEEDPEVVMEEKKDTSDEIMEENVENEVENLETEEVIEEEKQPEEINEMNVDEEAKVAVEDNVEASSLNGSTQNISSRKSSQTKLESNSKQASSSKLNKSNSTNNSSNNKGPSMLDKAFTEPASEQNEMRIYNGPIYCIEQVRIPPELPDIMKNYAKHIIRTQPDDVIIESYEYFKRLNKLRNSTLEEDYDDSDNNKPKITENDLKKSENNSNYSINLEQDNKVNKIQLSPLELESFYERLLDFSEGNSEIPISDLRNMAEDANITESQINEAIVVGSWDTDVEWLKFWSLVVASSCTSLKSTLQVIIDIIGDDNIIPLKKITSVVEFLLQSDPNTTESVANNIVSKLKEKDGDVIEKSELLDILSEL